MALTIRGINMALIETILLSVAHASSGHDHSHGPALSGMNTMLGGGLIILVTVAIYFLLFKKK